jgi:hypothetical protein
MVVAALAKGEGAAVGEEPSINSIYMMMVIHLCFIVTKRRTLYIHQSAVTGPEHLVYFLMYL